jgi:hypothetical protein
MRTPSLRGPFVDVDREAQSFRTTIRGSSRGRSLQIRTAPRPPGSDLGRAWKRPRLSWAVPLESRRLRYPLPGRWPGTVQRRPREPQPRVGNGFPGVGPCGVPGLSRAGHSPCSVRKSRPESMPVGRRSTRGRSGTQVSSDSAGSLGSERGAAEGPEWTVEERRSGVDPGRRPAPRARQPAPLPAPSCGPAGGQAGGLEDAPTLTRALASGCAPARNSRILPLLPPPPPTGRAGPVITGGGRPHALPCRGRGPCWKESGLISGSSDAQRGCC